MSMLIRLEKTADHEAIRLVIPFSTVGVLASLVTPLADAGISVFAISTFDTDYVLVKAESIQKTVAALRQAHKVE